MRLEPISWEKTPSAEFPYEAEHEGKKLSIRINDFPEEPFYTLFVDLELAENFDDWPKNWKRPK
ncbi:hypothetical protein EYW49_00270 [Siculibacillus lacustris]|uniref:Uncharacterized protein n=2 Tax=Siculibacillus lacustris TaxID=1549641 RepID=A0A4Q9VY33_9HYPH|nr:hypothetical protein EYW49_00270 [Siculibacillus lacustris]